MRRLDAEDAVSCQRPLRYASDGVERPASEARDATGVSLLMQCLYRGQRDLAELIAGKKKLDIFEAAGLGRIDRLRACIDDSPTGSSIDSASRDGFTALHFACSYGLRRAESLPVTAGNILS